MKQTFSLVALLFVCMAASAQHTDPQSALGVKQRLDSLERSYWNSYAEQWESSWYYYAYDEFGQMTLYYGTYKDYDSDEYLGDSRYEYSYNADGSMAESQYFSWDEDSDDWENDDWEVFFYDEDGNQTASVRYSWDETSELWTPRDSVFNVYNEEGLLSEYSGYQWKTDHWLIRYFSTYTYEEHGWLFEHLSRMWYEDDQEWKNNIKFVYTWNGQGQELTKIRSDQEVFEGPWLLEYKLEHFYNGENRLLTTNSAHWKTDQWEIYWTDTMDYASGLLMEDRTYYLDEGNMRLDAKDEYAYDASGNVTEYINHSWDRNALEVRLYGKSLFTYDPGYTMTDFLFPREDSDWSDKLLIGQYSNIPLGINIYEWENNSWEDYSKTAYFYSEVDLLGLDEGGTEMVRLYPNPVGDQLHVDLPEGSSVATMSLYEITGRQVLRRQLNAGGSLSLSTLPTGVYLYRLSVDGKIQSGKLLKR